MLFTNTHNLKCLKCKESLTTMRINNAEGTFVVVGCPECRYADVMSEGAFNNYKKDRTSVKLHEVVADEALKDLFGDTLTKN